MEKNIHRNIVLTENFTEIEILAENIFKNISIYYCIIDRQDRLVLIVESHKVTAEELELKDIDMKNGLCGPYLVEMIYSVVDTEFIDETLEILKKISKLRSQKGIEKQLENISIIKQDDKFTVDRNSLRFYVNNLDPDILFRFLNVYHLPNKNPEI